MAGSFISDGNGNITSGFVDGNSVTGQPYNSTVSGTYFIAADGLNTLTIQGTSFGPITYAFGLDSTGNGRIIEYDDTTGQGSRGSGALRKQDPTAFSLSKLNGGYVFGMAGVDKSAGRFTDVGVLTLSNGNITNGACDINDGGIFQTCTFTGSLPAIGTQTGRAVSTIQSNNGTSHQAVYVVTASEMVMEQIDSVPGTHTPLLVGSVLQQSGTFNNGTLNGLSVLYYQDIHAAEGADQSGALLFNFNGSGGGNLICRRRRPGGRYYTRPAGTSELHGDRQWGRDLQRRKWSSGRLPGGPEPRIRCGDRFQFHLGDHRTANRCAFHQRVHERKLRWGHTGPDGLQPRTW